MNLSAPAVALALLAPALPAGGEPVELRTRPVLVDDGPLLFLVHPENDKGEPAPGSDPSRTVVLYVLDPTVAGNPTPIWRGGNPRLTPVERVSEQQILMELDWRLFLVSLDKGTAVPLLEKEDQTELISFEGKEIFFLHRTIPSRFEGKGLKIGDDDKAAVDTFYRPRDFILRYVVGSEKPATPISQIPIEKMIETDTKGFWAITGEEPQRLVRIDRAGVVDEMMSFEPGLVAADVEVSFSPSRDHLALSVLYDHHDFHSQRSLVVCDLSKREKAFEDPDVPIGSFYAYPPPIDMDWEGESVLAYGDVLGSAARRLDVAKRRRLEALEKKGFIEQLPDEPRETRGHFELEFGKVYYKGDKHPVASVLDARGVGVSDYDVTPDGTFAAYCDPKDDKVYLIDGAKKTKTLILSGWSYGLEWK